MEASAGKNDSIDSSASVMSTAVPNVATVEKKARSPSGDFNRRVTISRLAPSPWGTACSRSLTPGKVRSSS